MSPRRVEVTGEITSIAYPGAGNSPVLRARIKAPEGEFVLAFLGRTIVRCIEVGSRLTVRGAVSGRDAVPTIFDPAYTPLPGHCRLPPQRRAPLPALRTRPRAAPTATDAAQRPRAGPGRRA